MGLRLNDKLLMSKAKRYAATLQGVEAYEVVMLSDDVLAWQRQALARLRSLEDVGVQGRLNHPVAPGALHDAIVALTGQSGAFACWMLYEGVIGLKLQGSDFKRFVERYLASVSSCDLSLAFEAPDAVLCVNDNEYDVTLHYLRR